MSAQVGTSVSEASKNFNVTPEFDNYLKNIIEQKLVTYVYNSGIGGQERPENKPIFKLLPNEISFEGKTNCLLVLGADRNAGPLSGKGGKGNTGAACIDLIAGLSGQEPIAAINDEVQETSKNFSKDAARIYISQKSNIDEYMKIPQLKFVINGNVKMTTEDSANKSSIALIADCTRILGRNTVKIVTYHHGEDSTKNDIEQNGVDIIAGVDALSVTGPPLPIYSLQPMVKGNNLILFLKALIEEISSMHVSIREIELLQSKMNILLANHVHQSGETITSRPVADDSLRQFSKDILKQSTISAQKIESKLGYIQSEFFNSGKESCILSNFNRVN